MKEVIMNLEMESIKPMSMEIYQITLGGYTFTVNGESICFDFDAFCCEPTQLEDGRLAVSYESGKGLVFNDYDISSDFAEEYEKLGLSQEDITAAFLASTTEMSEIYVDCYDTQKNEEVEAFLIVKRVFFTDQDGQVFKVTQAVIDAFNQAIKTQVQNK